MDISEAYDKAYKYEDLVNLINMLYKDYIRIEQSNTTDKDTKVYYAIRCLERIKQDVDQKELENKS